MMEVKETVIMVFNSSVVVKTSNTTGEEHLVV